MGLSTRAALQWPLVSCGTPRHSNSATAHRQNLPAHLLERESSITNCETRCDFFTHLRKKLRYAYYHLIYPSCDIRRQNGVKRQEKEGEEEGFSGTRHHVLNERHDTDIDAQKPKYKVGKDKAKSSNFTDTSFKSKCTNSASLTIILY